MGWRKNKGNKNRVAKLNPNLCAYLSALQERMRMDLPSQEYFYPELQMTSGFSKIYSACIDEFMIGYDIHNFRVSIN